MSALRFFGRVFARGSPLARRRLSRRLLLEPLEARLVLNATAVNLKVAFIGDQANGIDAGNVLDLISSEGADVVLHQGDFDYADNPTAWDQKITDHLGANFPYFASVGNHDLLKWSGPGGYQQKLTERLTRVQQALGSEVASCNGEYGVNSACTFQGPFFILSGVGTLGIGHAAYIQNELAQDDSIWSVCSWHKNQNAMQVGGKPDDTGWDVYENCREGGAIVATAHEHSYERTKTLADIDTQVVDPTCDDPARVCVGPGRTFVFVSGLGGNSIRDQERCLPTTPPYGCNEEWASIYTSSQSAQFGALFIIFNYDPDPLDAIPSDPLKAHGYFMNVSGAIVDEFDVIATPPSPGITVTPTSGLVTTEAGGTADFSVVLNTQPSADVTISLSSSDTTEGTVSPTSLRFTAADWNMAQTVTVTGANDDMVDGAVAYTIITNPAASSDPDYAGRDPSDVAVTNQDDDVTATVLNFSLFADGVVGGLSVANEDIVAFDGTSFNLLFDGSDVGLSSFRLDAFSIVSSSEILMSFAAAGSIPGIAGTVDDSDIVKFTATQLGTTTAGSFTLYFDGSDVGLKNDGEDVDAVELLADGRLLISTNDAFKVPGVLGGDTDLIRFTPTSLGPTTAGTWDLYFDGSDVGLSDGTEDVDGLAVDADGKIYFSTRDAFSVAGVSGADEDVFVFTPTLLGPSTSGTFSSQLFFDGSLFGLAGNDVFAIDLSVGVATASVATRDSASSDSVAGRRSQAGRPSGVSPLPTERGRAADERRHADAVDVVLGEFERNSLRAAGLV